MATEDRAPGSDSKYKAIFVGRREEVLREVGAESTLEAETAKVVSGCDSLLEGLRARQGDLEARLSDAAEEEVLQDWRQRGLCFGQEEGENLATEAGLTIGNEAEAAMELGEEIMQPQEHKTDFFSLYDTLEADIQRKLATAGFRRDKPELIAELADDEEDIEHLLTQMSETKLQPLRITAA